jgi:NAD(P)-dependent dehydrogenase (short-subunit alcohol dehydrogenase family)
MEIAMDNLSPLTSFPQDFRALIIGASGAIGSAFVEHLSAHPRCAHVVALHRHSSPAIDFEDEESVANAASTLAAHAEFAPFHLIINAAGILHTTDFMPEKKIGDLHYAQMLATFRTNAFGPALVLRHFSKLLDKQRGVLAVLSAKAGSIEDNHLGGWYSYRASKAALNMFLKTASIEVKRSNPNATLIALHPGTVNSRLSQPFKGGEIGRPPTEAAAQMLDALDQLNATHTGGFYSYTGEKLPW